MAMDEPRTFLSRIRATTVLGSAAMILSVAACTTPLGQTGDRETVPAATISADLQERDLDCSAPMDAAGRTFTEDEWIALSEELVDAALDRRIPLIGLCTDESRRVVSLLIESHESDWILGEVDTQLRPLAERHSDHVRVVYNPNGGVVPLPLYSD